MGAYQTAKVGTRKLQQLPAVLDEIREREKHIDEWVILRHKESIDTVVSTIA